jgi:hypothetical protein
MGETRSLIGRFASEAKCTESQRLAGKKTNFHDDIKRESENFVENLLNSFPRPTSSSSSMILLSAQRTEYVQERNLFVQYLLSRYS